jgi:hypothetical protein
VAIEVNAGDVDRQVRLLCRHLVPAQGGFSANSNPSETDIEDAIVVIEAEILVWLSSFGYSIVTSAYTANAKNFLSRYNALGAASQLELANSGLSTRSGPSNRADGYYRLYTALYDRLAAGKINLTALGIPQDTSSNMSASITGVSKTEKSEQETDADAVQPFFKRDLLSNPELEPLIEEN